MNRTRRITPSIAVVIARAAAFAGAAALLLSALSTPACKQPAPATVDAGPAVPAPVPTDAAPAVLVPMDEDAGFDAGAVVVHHGGPAQNTNQIRAKQCCAALKAQAGTDPSLTAIVGMCNAVAAQLGPSAGGQAPEFAAVRNMLKGHNMPAICQGL